MSDSPPGSEKAGGANQAVAGVSADSSSTKGPQKESEKEKAKFDLENGANQLFGNLIGSDGNGEKTTSTETASRPNNDAEAEKNKKINDNNSDTKSDSKNIDLPEVIGGIADGVLGADNNSSKEEEKKIGMKLSANQIENVVKKVADAVSEDNLNQSEKMEQKETEENHLKEKGVDEENNKEENNKEENNKEENNKEENNKEENNNLVLLNPNIDSIAKEVVEKVANENDKQDETNENKQDNETNENNQDNETGGNKQDDEEQNKLLMPGIEQVAQKMTDAVSSSPQNSGRKNNINNNNENTEENKNEVLSQDIEKVAQEIANNIDKEENENKLDGISNDLTNKLLDDSGTPITTPRAQDDYKDGIFKSPESVSTEPTTPEQISGRAISDEISGPRIVNRRNFEKSDASVQLDEGNDDFFTTAVDSPRVRPETENETENGGETEGDENDDNQFIPPLQPTSLFSPEELHAALQKQLKTKKLPPIEMREELINYSRKQSLYMMMAEDYDAAAKIDDAIDVNMKSLHQDMVNADASQQNMTLSQHLEEARNRKIILEEVHRQKIDDFKKMEQQRIDELQQQHDIDRRSFEAEWSTEDATRPFNKPSSTLFQIRRQQKALAISHDFQNARQLKRIGDQLQKEESHQATVKAAEAMRTQYIALLFRQNKEMQCLIEYGKRRLNQLETERDTELKANEIYRNALEARIKNPKQVRRPRVQIPQTKSRDGRPSITGVVTVRTRSQYANFKKSPETTRLEIKLGDVRKITKPLTPSPRKGKKAPPSPFA